MRQDLAGAGIVISVPSGGGLAAVSNPRNSMSVRPSVPVIRPGQDRVGAKSTTVFKFLMPPGARPGSIAMGTTGLAPGVRTQRRQMPFVDQATIGINCWAS
jgi:hypothetical protein